MLVFAVQQNESATCVHISPPSGNSLPVAHLGHHKAPSWAPCAIQGAPTSCLFYTLVHIMLLFFKYLSFLSNFSSFIRSRLEDSPEWQLNWLLWPHFIDKSGNGKSTAESTHQRKKRWAEWLPGSCLVLVTESGLSISWRLRKSPDHRKAELGTHCLLCLFGLEDHDQG